MADQEEQKPAVEEEQQTVGAGAVEESATTEEQGEEQPATTGGEAEPQPAPAGGEGEAEQPPQQEEPTEQPPESSGAEAEAEQAQAEEPTEGGGEEQQPTATEGEGEEKKEEGEGETAAPEGAAEGEQVEEKEEEEEPVVVTPEGNPYWLSTDDVLALGIPEDEVENYKNFHFKRAYNLQSCYDAVKEHTCQTEFISLTHEEVDVLLVGCHPGGAEAPELSDEQKQVLTQLEERIGQAISLYDEDGACIKVNFRSPKDAVLERSDAHFVAEIRDAVINELEVEKQSADAYHIWSEREERGGIVRRGITRIRRSFRRSRADSASTREQHKLEEEEKKEGEEGGEKKEEEGEGEKKEGGEEEKKEGGEEEKKDGGEEEKEGGEEEGGKKEEGGEEPAAEAPAAEEPAGETVTVDVTVEVEGKGAEEQAEAPQPEEQPPQQEEGGAEEGGEKKEGEGEAAKEGEGEEAKPATEGEGEIQEVGKEEGEKEGEQEEEKHVPKSARKKDKLSAEHSHRKVKAEPLDNQLLRAFGRAITAKYHVANGKEALEQLMRSFTFKLDLTQVKAFGAVEDARVSLSIRRWDAHMPRYPGMEFRGFVFNNELNALSQLDDTTYYPNVDHYKTTVCHKIDEFFREHVKETLKEKESYIIDFFVAPDKVYIINLSPFYTSVGACLFTWAEHAKVLVKGPFEFRIVEMPKTAPEAFSSFQAEWKSMLESVLEQRRNERRQNASRCVLL